MAYEYQYESGIKNIIHRHNLWVSDTDYKNAKESLNEIYRKAKAWDNYIAEVRERVRFTENTEDDIDRETQKVIDYYLEDE